MNAKSSKAKKPKKVYKDPLHIPSAELVVSHNGKEILILNKALLDRQNCWENLDVIKNLHGARLIIEEQMLSFTEETPKLAIVRAMETWTSIQFALQKAWGFTEDAKFHRFWDIPACKCPKLDNHDAYPTGYYVKSGGCLLHWL